MGCQAKNGTVPSGNDMEDYVKGQIAIAYRKDKAKYDTYKFSELCTMYDRKVSDEEKFRYFSDNFTDVILPKEKIDFVSIEWPYIYTLNADDAIEYNCNRYKVILPKKNFYDEYVSKFDIVFKIHGDANNYIKYIKEETLIFNKKQYIDSLKSNAKMLAKFEDDFTNNNLIYIGCSLSDEPDLLSIVSNTINSGKILRETYYVSSSPLDEEKSDLLEDYGVTTCIVVSDYNNFYKKIAESISQHPVKKNIFIDFYKEPEIIELKKEQSGLDFLLTSDNLIPIPFNRKIYKPYYYIRREVTEEIVRKLNEESPIHIVFGHRISGKTYCLFDVYSSIPGKERFFFPSATKITDDILDSIIEKKNALMIFDTMCLDSKQINKIIANKEAIDTNNSFIVIGVNSSDRYTVDLLADNERYKTTRVDNYFSREERLAINKLFESSTMPTFNFVEKKFDRVLNRDRKIYHTLLDNLCKIAVEFGAMNAKFSMPDSTTIESDKELSIIILLATTQAIASEEMYYFDLIKECADFSSKYDTLAEWAFFDEGQTRQDSRQKLKSNTRYYLLKILGDIASDKSKHDLVISSYKYLYQQVARSEPDEFLTSRKMLDYIKFDVINDIFYIKNNVSLELIKSIYEQMEDVMNINSQFKHQRAKSILWLEKNDISEMKKAYGYIKVAYYNTDINLKRNPSKWHLNISLGHIAYTRALIYGRICFLEKYVDIDNTLLSLEFYQKALFNPVNREELKILREGKTDKRIRHDLRYLLEHILGSEKINEDKKCEASDLMLDIFASESDN